MAYIISTNSNTTIHQNWGQFKSETLKKGDIHDDNLIRTGYGNCAQSK